MNARERFLKVLNFKKPEGRLPMLEWAPWWDKTVKRWHGEGVPSELDGSRLAEYFGLEPHECLHIGGLSSKFPYPSTHGGAVVTDEKSYEKIRSTILNDEIIESALGQVKILKARHEKGEITVRLWLDGFFWFPRSLFGIENHLLAFYDYPELMHRMNSELADFNLRAMKALFPVLKPDMVGFGEDMSYNHGSMISYELFREFMLPYYRRVVPFVRENGIKTLVDSDGDVTDMIPWLLEAGADGVYPLERQAGVDVAKLREKYPGLLILGAYDKMAMIAGEDAMRAEFERLLPVMRQGGFVPSVDHQTPPEVSIENYRIYLKLFEEYCAKGIG